ncbi:MAG: hypothetical protein JNK79_07525 [Chitinophagaceae bacterium]|nr:hypothetical protein [Chitinophagaceae bacterium]
MKWFILFSTFMLFVSLQGFSQVDPIEGTIEYQKGDKRAAIVEVPYPPEIVEGSLKQQFAKGGVKEQRLKGMQVFKNARLTSTDGEAADLYFKVQKKSRREDNVSIVYLVVGRPNENVALRTSDDAYRIQDAKSYLASLQPQAQSFELETNISKNEESIKKSERKLNDYQEDRKKLDKKIKEQEQELNRLKTERESLLGKKGSGS